jgi:Mrp family chromosome partitioning ATPase
MIAVIFFAIAIIMTFTHAFRIGCSAGQNARIKVCTLRPMQVQQDTVGWNREAIITTLDSVLEEKSGKSIIVCGLLKGVDTTDLKIKVELQFDEDTLDQRRGIIDACRTALTSIAPQEDISVTAAFIGTKVRNIIAVSSCKGGVGKSTVAVNLAYTLRGMGFATGILDADVFGPSLPTMTRASQRVLTGASNGRIAPWEYEGVRLMSLGFLNAGAGQSPALLPTDN